MEYKQERFMLSHIFFLLSLFTIYMVPNIALLSNDLHLPPMTRLVRFYAIAIFTLAFACYYLFLQRYRDAGADFLNNNKASLYFWFTTVAIALVLCAFPAVLSSDLYEYSIRGRMWSMYNLNPYLHVPDEIRQDCLYPLIFWKGTPECYGPVWVMIGAFHTFVAGNDVMVVSFLHKLVLLAFFLGSGFVFYRICRDVGLVAPGLTTAAFLANPLVIMMTLVDGHNEIAMVFFMLVSVFFLLRSRYLAAILFFALAVHVKFVYLVLLPVYVIYMFFDENKSLRGKLTEFFAGAAVFAVVFFIAWLPFGADSLKAIVKYYRDLGQLYWPDSIPYAAYFITGKMGADVSLKFVAVLFSALFAALYAFLIVFFARNVKRDKQAVFTVASLILLFLLFTNATPFQSWYLLWALPFILLSRIRARFLLVLLLSYFLTMAFWKRMSVLAIPMILVYALFLVFYDRYKEKMGFIFSLK